jgi:UDP-2,3-diacylglucosamine pyrophosphatase LpxH
MRDEDYLAGPRLAIQGCHTNVTKLTLSAGDGACYFCGAMETLDPTSRFRNLRVVRAQFPRRLRTAWISDVHLGTRGSNAAALLDFLRDYELDTLYIVGDLIDTWQMRRGIYWPQHHNDVIQKLLRKARKGTRIVYIPGNHDEFIGGFCGYYGHIAIQKQAIHMTADGRRILVIHGHELDTVVQNARWLAFAGDLGYQFLLSLNPLINFVRRRFGLGYWSLSAYAKKRVKDAVNFVGEFEAAIVRYAESHAVDAVLCGHIHSAGIRQVGAVTYYNCGDWVESCSALVENFDGEIELLNFHPLQSAPPPPIKNPELAGALL